MKYTSNKYYLLLSYACNYYHCAESRWETEWLFLIVYDLKIQVKRHHEMTTGGLPKKTSSNFSIPNGAPKIGDQIKNSLNVEWSLQHKSKNDWHL